MTDPISAFSSHQMTQKFWNPHRAAVLVPLVRKDGEWHILFEVRSRSIVQGGEICFPGGGIEEGESPEQAAMREAREELLIPASSIRITAPLFFFPGPGAIQVFSFLGELKDYHFTFSEDEVDHVFTLPLAFLESHPPKVSHTQLIVRAEEDYPWDLIPGGKNYPMRTIRRTCYFYETPSGVIWGMTAELLYWFLSEWKRKKEKAR